MKDKCDECGRSADVYDWGMYKCAQCWLKWLKQQSKQLRGRNNNVTK